MNNGYLLLISSSLSLGISSIFFYKSTNSLGAVTTTLWYYLFGFIISLVIYFISKKEINTNYKHLVWPMLTAIFLTISVYTYNISLKTINVSVASTIRSLSFVFTIIIAVVFTGEVIDSKQLIGGVLTVIGVILMSNS